MKNVIYEVHLEERNKLGHFKKEVVEEFEDLGAALISLTHWRENNIKLNIRYVLGHIK